MFHIDVTKVDRDIANIAMAIHVCCKRIFQMFHLFFQTYVASVFCQDVAYVSHICLPVLLSGCCICFAVAFKCF